MKSGDKVKCFAQVGLMKEPRWLNGIFVEPGIVEIHGNRVCLETGKIKGWRPLPHDDNGCPAVREFTQSNWENLCRIVTQASDNFIPNDTVVFDEDEKTIEIDGITIAADYTEVTTIADIRETPCWTVSYWVQSSYSYLQPPDADEVVCGHAFNNYDAARLLIDSVLKCRADAYWDSQRQTVEY